MWHFFQSVKDSKSNYFMPMNLGKENLQLKKDKASRILSLAFTIVQLLIILVNKKKHQLDVK
jgi:hypothetical protein